MAAIVPVYICNVVLYLANGQDGHGPSTGWSKSSCFFQIKPNCRFLWLANMIFTNEKLLGVLIIDMQLDFVGK